MNVNSLYKLASILDAQGKYLEADVILESMMRLAKGAEKYFGNRARKPKVPFNAMPGARPAAPITPIAPLATAPAVSPAAPVAAVTEKTQTPGPRPSNQGRLNNDLRIKIWNNRSLNPKLYDLLELEHSLGRFNPKTGEFKLISFFSFIILSLIILYYILLL
jgi:hypothetical protein